MQLVAAENWLNEQRTILEGQADRLAIFVENQQRKENPK
jgi:hypothetical protein